MHTTTIIYAGKPIHVRAWQVAPKAIVAGLQSGKIKDARDISFSLLSDGETYQTMRREEHGDSAEHNFALAVFEHALDWRLGGLVLSLIQSAALKFGRMPKPFIVCTACNGDLFAEFSGGRIVKY